MSIVIILYLAVLTAFVFGNLYKGRNLFKPALDDADQQRIRLTIGAQAQDEVSFRPYIKYDAILSILMGFLYLALAGITFLYVPNLWGTLTVREIHLIRTCIIAGLVLHLTREMWMAAVRERFIKRNSNTQIGRFNLKTSGAFAVLAVVLVYSVYIQMTYSW